MQIKLIFRLHFDRMKKIFLIVALSIGTFSFNQASATHAAGGELTYKLVPNTTNQYEFIFKFFRDCDGAAPAPSQVIMCYNNSCGTPAGTQSIVLTTTDAPLPYSLSTGCDSFLTTCDQGAPPNAPKGYIVWTYTAVVTLPTQCNFWRFWCVVNARNNAISTLVTPGSQALYVEAIFDNSISQMDDSPTFTVDPIPYACINDNWTFDHGVIDVNGDSLFFECIAPRDANSTCTNPAVNVVPYTAAVPAYNFLNNPFQTNNTFNIDPQTGFLSAFPTQVQYGVYVVKVSAYRNGQLISTVMRDLQLAVVSNCPPPIPPTSVDSTTVVGSYVDSLQVRTCFGDSVSFCSWIADSNASAILTAQLLSNSATGSSTSFQFQASDSILFCFSWLPTIADTGISIINVQYIDSTCAPPGILKKGSRQFTVIVDPPTRAFGDTTICLGETAQLSTVVSGPGGTPNVWDVLPGGAPISSLSCTICDSPTATPNLPTFYTVTGCTTDTVFVDVVTGPTPTITPDTTICVNSSIQLQVVANPPTLQYTYNWSPGALLDDSTITNPTWTNPTTTTTFTVGITPVGFQACISIDSVTVNILDGFSIDPYDTIICDGQSTNITGAGSSQYTYSWSPGADLSSTNTIPTTITPAVPGGSYTITASFPGCPDSVITIPVIVDPIPVVFAGVDREMCLNDTVQLSSSAMPSNPNYTIDWSPAADLNGPSVPDPVFSGTNSTLLTVTYTTENGCEGEDDVNVIVNSVDFLLIDGDRSLCPGDTTSLSVLGGNNYYWYPDYYISDVGNVSNVTVYPDVSTRYYVVGVDQNDCIDTAQAFVQIEQGSIVDAGEEVTIYPGESVNLIAEGNCSFFNWFPPSGLSSTAVMNPVASPTVTTKYVVTAQTENGCPTSDSVIVKVSTESLLDLPNAFSPGSGTSVNDLLQLKKRGIVTLNSWKMFNRWGELVFSTEDIDAGWDGRYNGKPQPLGVYVYFLEATTSAGKKFYKQGNVTLIR